jgi:hypothetical protein
VRVRAKATSSGSFARFARSFAAASAATLLTALAFLSVPALAGPGVDHPFLSSFDGSGTPQGRFTAQSEAGLSIDQVNGHIVVADSDVFGLASGSNERFAVSIFSAAGDFISQIDGEDLPPIIDPGSSAAAAAAVAVDNSGGSSQGNIYITLAGEDLVLVFNSSGNYLRTLDGSNTPAGSFVIPKGVAVDVAGNLYVADTGAKDSGTVHHGVIDKFDSQGNYISQISGPHTNIAGHLAADSAGNLYAVNSNEGVAKFNAAGSFQYVLGTKEATRVAVAPTTNDVYIAEGRYLTQYDSAGKFLGRFGSAQIGRFVGGIGVSSTSGKVFAIDQIDPVAPFRVVAFGPGTPVTSPDVVATGPTDDISYFEATFHGVVNPQGVPTTYRFEYRERQQSGDWRATPEQTVGSGVSDVAVSATVNDLQLQAPANGRSYEVRLVATNSDADTSTISGVETFATQPVPLPSAVVNPPSGITATGAHLSGALTLPPPGFASQYKFEYTRLGGGGGELAAHSAGSGPGEVPAADDLSGLEPNTQYSVRLTVSNVGGSTTSSEKTFTTAPAPPSQVETIPVGELEVGSARLGGWVNPSHSPTVYWLEYGLADCASNPCTSVPSSQDADAGSDLSSSLVSQVVSGLEPDTTYHYRIVAKNPAGTSYGNDITFTTDDPTAPGPPERGIELVNTPEKGNQPLFGHLLDNGQEALWVSYTGIPGSPSGVKSLFRSSRTAAGWQSESVLPPADELLGDGVKGYRPVSVSPDGSRYLLGLNYTFNDTPEYAIVDLNDHTQLALGSAGENSSGDRNPSMFSDAAVKQIYTFTRRQFSPEDDDSKFDIYAYELATESWSLVGRRPNGTDPACAVIPASGSENDLAIAPDTSSGTSGEKRLFFLTTPTDNCTEPDQLFVRDLVAGTTTAISTPALGSPGEVDASYIRASSDGSAAVYKTEAALSPGDTNKGEDVYLWRAGAGNECITCVVPDAAVDRVMASTDLSYIYFSSTKKLVAGRGVGPSAASAFLYVIHDGVLDYIGPVTNGLQLGSGEAYAEMSTDGSVATFSASDVTADKPQAAIYRYDTETKEVQCVSCSESPGFGGLLPASAVLIGPSGGKVHTVSADGDDIVFETRDPLSPLDVNGSPDIYEWRDGKTTLVTDGVREFPVNVESSLNLAGISPDASNILFRASAHLTGYELDHEPNIYVARVGGGFPPPPQPPAPCSEDSCQGPLQAPPRFDTPGSKSFSGPGSAKLKSKKNKKKQKHRHKKKRRHATNATHRNG